MPQYTYRLLNVFAESTFSGNPLCVFEDGSGLSDATMQNLARQFNLSETVFLFPTEHGSDADALLRIFTPTGELPFAGHPSIGASHVMGQRDGRNSVRLQTRAGAFPVQYDGIRWTLTAPCNAKDALTRPCEMTASQLGKMLRLDVEQIESDPIWFDTGSEQLLLGLRSAAALQTAQPDENFAQYWPTNRLGRKNVFLFVSTPQANGSDAVHARYFFKSANGVGEDPGTGSACINLGAWLYSQSALPRRIEVTQGAEMGRPCRIQLDVSADGEIRVGGNVIELGAGHIDL